MIRSKESMKKVDPDNDINRNHAIVDDVTNDRELYKEKSFSKQQRKRMFAKDRKATNANDGFKSLKDSNVEYVRRDQKLILEE